jgi:surface polysaccharide O-acyltransferase-like enzyme
MNSQIQYFNNLRALACFLVVLTHSAMPALDQSFGVFMVLISVLSSPSSELFVTMSSSLLAPTKQSQLDFYKRRFSKLLWPFLFWSVIILLILFFQQRIDFQNLIQRILLIPFKPAHGVYWFVYVIMGLYLIIPVISPWLKSCTKREHQVMLALWGATLIWPLISVVFHVNIYNVEGSYYSTWAYVGGFIGYLLLGVYLRKFPIEFKTQGRLYLFCLGLVTLGTLPIAYGYAFNRPGIHTITDNLSLSSALYVMAIFVFVQNVKFPVLLENFCNVVAKYSFGIYLIHIIVIRDIIWSLLENNRLPHPLIETPLIAVASFFICLAVVKLISYLPKSKYIIGV